MNARLEHVNYNKQLVGYTGSNKLRIELENQILELKDVLLFPGLINSHDHLEFNSFPCLANKIYTDYNDWGADIHTKNKNTIEETLKIPVALRIKWGILKNLICGVTGIVHHGHHHDFIKTLEYPVILNYQYVHSLATDRLWKIKLNIPSRKDIMVHVGEGTSDEVVKEIDRLLQWNLLKRNLIGIHAIGMTPRQSKKFKSLVWCPESNIKLYGQTANVDLLKHHTKILFGTDSALTGSSNMWDHLRLARDLKMLSDSEIFESLTTQPLDIFNGITNNTMVVTRQKAANIWDSFFLVNPEDILLVIINTQIFLIDQSMMHSTPETFAPVRVGNSIKLVPNSWAIMVKEFEAKKISLPLNVIAV